MAMENFPHRPPPVAMTVAGSDNSAGAGIQADLKTFSALGVYGLTSVTCVVAEIPGRVESVQPVDPAVLEAQIRLGLDAFPVAAVKTGMLYSQSLIRTCAEALAAGHGHGKGRALVVDPVMVASSGDRLLEEDAVRAYTDMLFPMADLITPNLDEAGVLLDAPINDVNGMAEAAERLARRFGCAVLLKGGHLETDTVTDILTANGEIRRFEAPFRRGVSTHGTGCTYAAAITAGLASGRPLPDAVAAAKEFVRRAIDGIHVWERAGGQTMALRH